MTSKPQKTITFLAMCLLASACADTNRQPTSLKDDAVDLAASAYFSGYCENHVRRGSVVSVVQCDYMVEQLMVHLDSPAGDLIPCFPKVLRELLTSKEGHDYITAVHAQLDRLAKASEPFDLWNLTLDYVQGDRDKALKWIAVLFQETTYYKEMIGTFKLHDSTPLGNEADFLSLMKAFNPTTQAHADRVNLYPQPLPAGAGLYHFYVPAYLASLLRAESHNSGDAYAATYAPILFNAVYEYTYINKTPDEGHRNSLLGKMMGIDTSFYTDTVKTTREPKTIDLSQPDAVHAVVATYYGYAGATWTNHEHELSYDDFSKSFTAGPTRFFRDFLKKQD